MNDKDDHPRSNLPQRDRAFLLVVGLIGQAQSIRIVKNDLGRLEIDAVFGEVLPVLLLIVLKSHPGLFMHPRLNHVHTIVNMR